MKKYKLITMVLGVCLGNITFANSDVTAQALIDAQNVAQEVAESAGSDTVNHIIMPQQDELNSVINFSTIYSQEVPRDVMVVTLFIQKEAKALAEISAGITAELNQAIDIAKKQGIDDLITQRNSYIRYDKNGRATGWIDRVELTLSGKNFEALANVIAQLEGKMAIQEMRFDISKQQKKELEQIMTQKALQAFKQKAQLMSQELGAKGYQIVSLNVSNVNEYSSPTRPMMYQKMASVATSEAMQLESGRSDVQVSISASIRLLP